MYAKTILFALLIFATLSPAQTYLTPHDLGLPSSGPLPPHLLTGCYNDDPFMDIARACGNRLEIYYFQDQGYPARPQAVKLFDQPLRCLSPAGNPWGRQDDIAVTLQDGSRQVFRQCGRQIDLGLDSGFLLPAGPASPPRQISDISFQPGWQSPSYPYGMNMVAVGPLYGDGSTELVTWWKSGSEADTAYILIYQLAEDSTFVLDMQEPIHMNLYPDSTGPPAVTALLMDDIDQNGQMEIIFTQVRCWFWEFSAPRVYRQWHSDFTFVHPVTDLKTTDVDQNGVKEITQLGYYAYSAPQQSLMVRQYWFKYDPDSSIYFYPVADITWEAPLAYYWGNFAAGDFDNDGAVEIALGILWGVSSWPDTWVRYFRYTPGAPNNFVENWLVPGAWANCVSPIITDLDHDGRQELYAGGFGGYSQSSNGFGSAYVWKRFSPDSSAVVWLDTTSMVMAPVPVVAYDFDTTTYILNDIALWLSGQFFLYGFQNTQGQLLWQSQMFDNIYFGWPVIYLDQSNNIHFISEKCVVYAPIQYSIQDWEQTSSGIGFNPAQPFPQDFTLYPISPNPFNGSTHIPFDLPCPSEVEMTIHDLTGRRILDLKQDDLAPGRHIFTWQADPHLASGVYLITLNAAGQHHSLKAVLLK